MAQNFNTNTHNKEDWLTPPYIIKALGEFDLDPCAPINRPWDTAKHHYTKLDNGLAKPWFGRVWCNPPYGRKTFDGNRIALIFARTETKGFHSEIWGKADGIFFFKGRLRFYTVGGEQGGAANAPSCLVAYGAGNAERLCKADLPGKFVQLRL